MDPYGPHSSTKSPDSSSPPATTPPSATSATARAHGLLGDGRAQQLDLPRRQALEHGDAILRARRHPGVRRTGQGGRGGSSGGCDAAVRLEFGVWSVGGVVVLTFSCCVGFPQNKSLTTLSHAAVCHSGLDHPLFPGHRHINRICLKELWDALGSVQRR